MWRSKFKLPSNRSIRIDNANNENIRRFEARDFPEAEVSEGEIFSKVDKDPWPPMVSTHPPSIFF